MTTGTKWIARVEESAWEGLALVGLLLASVGCSDSEADHQITRSVTGHLVYIGGPPPGGSSPRQGAVSAEPLNHDGTATRVTSDDGGAFVFHLRPGRYQLSDACQQVELEVTHQDLSGVELACHIP